jgi:hypothetical protein
LQAKHFIDWAKINGRVFATLSIVISLDYFVAYRPPPLAPSPPLPFFLSSVMTFNHFLLPRTFIYSLLTRGRPLSAVIFLKATAFCIGNGLLQAYYLVYCAEYPEEWYTDMRFSVGE